MQGNFGSRRTWFLWFTASAFMALAQLRLVVFVLGKLYPDSIHAAFAVLNGTPAWAINQSRVLAPYTIAGLATLTGGNFGLAHVIFMWLMTFIAGLLFLTLVTRQFGQQAGWAAFATFHLLFSVLLNEQWLFAWDHYSIISFTLFVYFALTDKSWRWFACLFAVSIFNRESALFIAMWMVIQPLSKAFFSNPHESWMRRVDKTMCAAGLLCGIAGLGVLHILRTTLLIHEENAAPGVVHNLLVTWPHNLDAIADAFTSNLGVRIICPGFLVFTAALCILLARRNPARFFALGLTHLALVVSIFLFGVITETRIMLELVPFVVFGLVWLNTPKATSHTASGSHAEKQKSPVCE
jgi:hypothetical protein